MSNHIALSGDLKFISLADLFQMLESSNRSGTLKLKGPLRAIEGVIYFVDGNPVNANDGSRFGIDAIYKMFGWMEGRFEFCDESVDVEPVINIGSMRIVLDALRLLDEGAIESIGIESGSPSPQPDEPSISDNSVIKGPPVDYAYFLEEERFADGEKIVGEGKEGNWMWVILKGTVKISIELPNGSLVLGYLGEGSFIGTFTSFEYWKNARFATVTAVGHVCLGVLDSVALCARYCALSRDFQKLLLGLSIRMKKINDRIVSPSDRPLPLDLPPDPAGSIIEEQKLNNEAFIITNGQAQLYGKDTNDDRLLFGLEKGDVLGKLPFYDIGQEPGCARVIASENLEIRKIDTDTIMKEYARLPRVLRNMINNVSTCVAKTTLDFLENEVGSHTVETVN